MKSAILYSSLHEPVNESKSDQRFTIQILDKEAGEFNPVYLRAEIVDSDTLHALDMAKPRKGEMILNSIEL